MKTVKLFIAPLLFVALASCATIYDVNYDYDQAAAFSDLKRYDWMPVTDSTGLNSLALERIQAAVDNGLQAKGLMRTSEAPDFLIAPHIGKKDKVQVNDMGYGYGPFGGYWGGNYGAMGGVSTYEYEEGTLILDFVNAESKQLIWRGSAKAEIQDLDTPEKKEKVIGEAVEKMLEKFPPPQK
jgi:hypothetical protein